MAATIFFSWQADRATLGGRNLLERALESAIGRLGEQADLEEADRNEFVLDKDTRFRNKSKACTSSVPRSDKRIGAPVASRSRAAPLRRIHAAADGFAAAARRHSGCSLAGRHRPLG
jgi:hypothetical protein